MIYYVIFFDGSVKEITEEFYEKILEATMTEAVGIEIGAGFYKFSSISKILSREDYLTQYPQAAKASHQPYSLPQQIGHPIISEKERKEILLRGLRRVKPQATMKDVEDFISPKVKEVKYKTWEEAKAAGVF